jgi:zinc protease
LGSRLPGASSPAAATLAVTTSILSNRLYANLREKQGLAYATGASSHFDREFGWYYCMISTAPENYQRALGGLILQIDKLRLDGPTDEEIMQAKNAIWGRLMSAKLSRINQAYYLTVDEFLGRELTYDSRLLEELAQVTVESVRRAASKHFRTDSYVLATAGKQP